MSKAIQSALTGLAVAVVAGLVAFGVLGGEEADALQGILITAIAFGGTVGVRSARKPKGGE